MRPPSSIYIALPRGPSALVPLIVKGTKRAYEAVRRPGPGKTHLDARLLAHYLEIFPQAGDRNSGDQQREIKHHLSTFYRTRFVGLDVVSQRREILTVAARVRLGLAPELLFKLPPELL